MNPINEKHFPRFISRILVLFICVSVLTTYSAAQKVADFDKQRFKISSLNSEDAPQAEPVLVPMSGNFNCQTLNRSTDSRFAGITSDFGFKIEPPQTGAKTYRFTNADGELTGDGNSTQEPNSTVTTTLTNGIKTLNFTMTKSISAVIVKAGNEANVYVYDPAAMNGGPLVGPDNKDISHIEFCYGSTASVTIIKEVTTNGGGTFSTTMFPFTVSGKFSDGFNLVDNNNVGPDRKIYSNITAFGAENQITITENPFGTGFQLNDIECSGGTTTKTFNSSTNGGSVTMTVQAGDSVVCTFKNGTTTITAAAADISGRVLTDNGRGISRAIVTVLDTNTLESRSVITNRFGYFSFQQMPVGDFYLISVKSKGYWFAGNNQGFGLTGDLTTIEFTGAHFYDPVIGSSIFGDVVKSKMN